MTTRIDASDGTSIDLDDLDKTLVWNSCTDFAFCIEVLPS